MVNGSSEYNERVKGCLSAYSGVTVEQLPEIPKGRPLLLGKPFD